MAECILSPGLGGEGGGNVRSYVTFGMILEENNGSYRVDDSQTREHDTPFTLDPTNGTVEICAKINDIPNTWGRLVDVGVAGDGFVIQVTPSSDYKASSSDYAVGPMYGVDSAEAIENLKYGDTHTFSYVLSSGNAMFYLDGVYVMTISGISTSVLSNKKDMYIMGTSRSDRRTKGIWYDVRLYNRQLTSTEIANNYLTDKSRYL